jgi:tRNA pseudouridine13 synthase
MRWPYLTDPQLSICAQFKTAPEDFQVEEVPLYTPCGSGEHLYIFIEKVNLSTDQVILQLSQHLGIRARDIGCAGKKDRVGITRQWISLPRTDKKKVESLTIPGVRILDAAYHRNKLRPGHLAGNRFQITLREAADPYAEKTATAIFSELEQKGVPNYYGPQRFGNRGDNAVLGAAILTGNWKQLFDRLLGSPSRNDTPQIREARNAYEAGKWSHALTKWPKQEYLPRTALRLLIEADGDFHKAGKMFPRNMSKFFLNALQSYWFNATLARRIPHLHEIWTGDLAYLHRNGAVFLVDDARKEQPRADAMEISPSGPLWGHKMILPRGKEWELETQVLEETGASPDWVQERMKVWRIRGERRSFRMPIRDIAISFTNGNLTLSFQLPPGGYATAVLRELLKEHLPEPEIVVPVFRQEK